MLRVLDDEKEFVAHLNEQIEKVEKNGKVYLTKFLTLREKEIIKENIKYKDVSVIFDGGYDNAERVRCLLYPSDITVNPDFNITCFAIEYNKRYLTLTHQNILGTLMSLQIDRSLFGDIVFVDTNCYFFASTEISYVLHNEFTMINKVPVQIVEYNQRLETNQKYLTKEIMITSLRIDNVISHVYNMSRDMAKKYVVANNVFRNFQLIYDPSAKCEINDIISVRKYGRFIISQILRKTKNDKLVVEIKIPAS